MKITRSNHSQKLIAYWLGFEWMNAWVETMPVGDLFRLRLRSFLVRYADLMKREIREAEEIPEAFSWLVTAFASNLNNQRQPTPTETMNKRSRGPTMPTTIRALRRALKEESTSVSLTPSERLFVVQTFPSEASSRLELLLYSRLRELFKFTKDELDKLPALANELGNYDDLGKEISLSIEQLELLETHLETLEKAGKLPNISAILTAWEKFENALEDDPENDEISEAQSENNSQPKETLTA